MIHIISKDGSDFFFHETLIRHADNKERIAAEYGVINEDDDVVASDHIYKVTHAAKAINAVMNYMHIINMNPEIRFPEHYSRIVHRVPVKKQIHARLVEFVDADIENTDVLQNIVYTYEAARWFGLPELVRFLELRILEIHAGRDMDDFVLM